MVSRPVKLHLEADDLAQDGTDGRVKIVVVSPHRGDACFSLALSIGAWLKAGHAVTILNVFTRSVDAPFSDADSVHENDRLAYVSAMRRKEDEAFLRMVRGAAMVDGNIKDAPLRLHCDPAAVFELAADSVEGAGVKIRKALGRYTSLPGVAVVLPLGLGGHVDHRVAREASLDLVAHLPVAFYEDMPYAAAEGVAAEQEGLLPAVCAVVAPVEWKRKAMLEYSSQIEEETVNAVCEFAGRYGGKERLWANVAFLAATGVTAV